MMKRSIQEIGENIKRSVLTVRETIERKDVYVMLMVIVVGVASFGLGRLSKLQEDRPRVTLEQAFVQTSLAGAAAGNIKTQQQQGLLVASRNGSKYHFPWCSGAQRIKEENKIWFASAQEAQKSGYTAAKNCKGL